MPATIRAVGFDLGNTLVQYYTRAEWAERRSAGLALVAAFLAERGLLRVSREEIDAAAERERELEPADCRVRPLEKRLTAIFRLCEGALSLAEMDRACRLFLEPGFAGAVRYEDTIPVLERLRAAGLRIGILSNTPWGSPQEPWREEVTRHGLTERVDAVLFCRDAGWRKPARPPFELLVNTLGVRPEECLFVGDEPRWDLAGAEGAGLPAVLLDRTGRTPGAARDLWATVAALVT